MKKLAPTHFGEFFEAIHGYGPFPWQERLAARVCAGEWPRVIALPTAAGKTACIDIAVFALACRVKNAPRRIFFVVDRRIVVDQAYLHAKKLAQALRDAKSGILKAAADSLRALHLVDEADHYPLDVYALRGGMYRETAWTRSPLQPIVIASTVDQIGSRLLFRGYGVSDSMAPIHAALVGNDALILLDEAHCARPFEQTLEAVESYRGWNESVAPFRFVSISATPAKTISKNDLLTDQKDDDRHKVLGPRMKASKPAKLEIAERAKGKKGEAKLVELLEGHARKLLGTSLGKDKDRREHFVQCVGIIVNRVNTARELYRRLWAEFGDDVVLLTGRMRPLDREKIYETRLKQLLSNSESNCSLPKFVVGTQCLECGADLDFHALVTECASLDALRQRFGRLNRVAARPGARAVIVIRGDQIEAKEKETERDPIYGNSLANTWRFLNDQSNDGIFDFGVNACREVLKKLPTGTSGELSAPTSAAPFLFPSYLDCWVQTHPRPTPDPDPAPFLHGAQKPGSPDVSVVLRSDLCARRGPGDARVLESNQIWGATNLWADIVSLCPPSSAETVSVPIGVFKQWLAGRSFDQVDDASGDIEGEMAADVVDESPPSQRFALDWRGPEDSNVISSADEVRPNAVYVIPAQASDIRALGDFLPATLDPSLPPADYAQEAFQHARDKAFLQLRDSKLTGEDEGFDQLLISEIAGHSMDGSPEWLKRAIDYFTSKRIWKLWDVDEHPLGGWVVTGKRRLCQFDPTYLADSEPATSYRGEPVTLSDHSRGVASFAHRFATGCGLDAGLFAEAGFWHDLGKLDPRFQAMLKQTSPRSAVSEAWAKSLGAPLTQAERNEARKIHCYPRNARHELLSAALVATKTDDDLLLYLITTHHGAGRPFADPVEENQSASSPFVTPPLFGQVFALPNCAQQIRIWNLHIAERFWRIVRKFGWWGAAHHEAVFRLADHARSRAEQEKPDEKLSALEPRPFQCLPRVMSKFSLPLPGLDGANPLGFLAAVGTLVAVDGLSQAAGCPRWLADGVNLQWGTEISRYVPVLQFSAQPPEPEEFADFLADHLCRCIEEHPAAMVVHMLERGFKKDTSRDFSLITKQATPPRPADWPRLGWVTALSCELAIDADSQLQTVRCDYLIGNLRSILQKTTAGHLHRALFLPWDYADALDNQSLHWEPTEDRRHAYQWHTPSGDPTRKKRGGMLGANRLALEAWPLFPSFPVGDRVTTRGFRGLYANDTHWTWPLWTSPASVATVASLLASPAIQNGDSNRLWRLQLGIAEAFRVQRILVGKTPNFTTAAALE